MKIEVDRQDGPKNVTSQISDREAEEHMPEGLPVLVNQVVKNVVLRHPRILAEGEDLRVLDVAQVFEQVPDVVLVFAQAVDVGVDDRPLHKDEEEIPVVIVELVEILKIAIHDINKWL